MTAAVIMMVLAAAAPVPEPEQTIVCGPARHLGSILDMAGLVPEIVSEHDNGSVGMWLGDAFAIALPDGRLCVSDRPFNVKDA